MAMRADTTLRVLKLRKLLNLHKLHAHIIPSADAHQSEYVADCDKRRGFVSGFTGSAGTALVTKNEALVWTDGRYFLQASQQLDSNWKLMKMAIDVDMNTWLAQNLPPNSAVGIDPHVFSADSAKSLKKLLESKGHSLVSLPHNPVDLIWENKFVQAVEEIAAKNGGTAFESEDERKLLSQPEQEARPASPAADLTRRVFPHLMEFAGETHESKISRIREKLQESGAGALVISALDAVAWTFNLRGGDVECNPVFWSYGVITPTEARLYVETAKADEAVRAHLGSSVTVRPYDAILGDLKELAANPALGKICMDPSWANYAVYSAVPSDRIAEGVSPITLMKSLKNDAELNGFRQAHIRDAVALCSFLSWLEDAVAANPEDPILTECGIADRLEQFRREQEHFVGLSFDTIAGSGPNGAIIHYKPEKETCARVDPTKMFLLDSGAQYKDGTTDVTRTFHLGTPSQHEKECYTRVLQGHIALDRAVFPAGTTGFKLDILARLPLWSVGLEYLHGTGHGVGSFLNVHEGPQGVSFRVSSNEQALLPGMTVTNEPGYYEDGAFGIRIENVLAVKTADTPFKFGGKEYYGFERFTMVPIQTKLMETKLMTPAEIEWVNTYHAEVRAKVSPRMSGRALEWLLRSTEPISA